MTRRSIYVPLLLLVLALQACTFKKQLNWRVTLDPDDKKPYGAYLAYQSLRHYFPGITTEAISSGFRYSNIDPDMMYNEEGASLLILSGLEF